ncbi:hypothetical protein [Sorangium sp. So ce887]|uniref:hypothetical protein n=1 Tax=Sorangium sp. So ce887 TaxID=3133324 RepID=UPI003F5FF092
MIVKRADRAALLLVQHVAGHVAVDDLSPPPPEDEPEISDVLKSIGGRGGEPRHRAER